MQTIPKINQYSVYAVCLIPLALLTGPFLPDLIVSLLSLVFIYILTITRDTKYICNYFSYFFFSFCIYLIFNSLISDYLIFSLKSSLFYFRFGLFSLFIWYLIDNDKEFLNKFTLFLIIAFFIAIVSGVYQYIYSETIFGNKPQDNRLLLLFSDNEALGQWLSRLFPLLVALLVLNFKPQFSYYSIIFLLLISIDTLVYLSGERTSLGLMFASSLFIILLMKKLRLFRLITILFSIFIIVMISILNPEIKERNIDYTIEQLGLDDDNKKVYIFSPLHENYIRTSLKMFNDNKLFGVGTNNYRNFCDKEKYKLDHKSCSTHPHHNYIQVLAESGIIGFIFFLSIILYFMIKTLSYIYYSFKKISYLNDYQVCLIACFLCTFLPTLPTMNFFNNWINIIYYLPLGFYLQSLYNKKKQINIS